MRVERDPVAVIPTFSREEKKPFSMLTTVPKLRHGKVSKRAGKSEDLPDLLKYFELYEG